MKTAGKRQTRAACWGSAVCTCVLALATILATSTRAGGASDPKVTVLVYNYAEVSSGVLQGGETEATRVFTVAGISMTWVDCSNTRIPARSGLAQAPEAATACFRPVSGADVVLRILSRSTPASRAFHDTMFGFAEGAFVASVFYVRLEQFAQGEYGNQTEVSVILGDVIAHEIGHLLLGDNSHSRSGIMSGKWDPEYLRLAREGFQTFSPAQSAVMRAAVLRRQAETIQP
jgi:hypothetical protein